MKNMRKVLFKPGGGQRSPGLLFYDGGMKVEFGKNGEFNKASIAL